MKAIRVPSHRALIQQGDTLTWLVRPNTLADGAAIASSWVVRGGVFKEDGTAAIAATVFEDTRTYQSNEHIVVSFTRAQTAALDEGSYRVAIDVYNASVSPTYSDESIIFLQVGAQLIPA